MISGVAHAMLGLLMCTVGDAGERCGPLIMAEDCFKSSWCLAEEPWKLVVHFYFCWAVQKPVGNLESVRLRLSRSFFLYTCLQAEVEFE